MQKKRPTPFFFIQLFGPFRPYGRRGDSRHKFELAITKWLEDQYLGLAQISELLARRILQIGLLANGSFLRFYANAAEVNDAAWVVALDRKCAAGER